MTKLLLVIALTILVTFAVATPVLLAGLRNFTATTASRADLRFALEELLDRLDDMDDADNSTPTTTYDI